MAISKIILNGVTQIDLTGDTVQADKLLYPYTAHKNDGTQVTGEATQKTLTTKTITSNGTYDAEDDNADGYSSVTVAVPSTSKNIQVDNTTHRISGTTYVDTGASIKAATAGTYDIYWSAFRSSTSSGTNGTQCYVDGNTQGSAFTTWENSYAQAPKLTGVTLAKNAVVKVYARASSNSRYVCVSNLTIVQTS